MLRLPGFPADHGAQGSGEYRSHRCRSPTLFDERGQRLGGDERVAVEIDHGDVLGVGPPTSGRLPRGGGTECPRARRPRRSQQDALDALGMGLLRKKVNWVLDADIRGFFESAS